MLVLFCFASASLVAAPQKGQTTLQRYLFFRIIYPLTNKNFVFLATKKSLPPLVAYKMKADRECVTRHPQSNLMYNPSPSPWCAGGVPTPPRRAHTYKVGRHGESVAVVSPNTSYLAGLPPRGVHPPISARAETPQHQWFRL